MVFDNGASGILSESTPDHVVRALFDPDGDPDLPKGLSWLDALTTLPYAALAAPVVAYSLVVVLWGGWILRKMLVRRDIPSWELFVLIIAVRQLVFLISFVAWFRLDYLRERNEAGLIHIDFLPLVYASLTSMTLGFLQPANRRLRFVLFLSALVFFLGTTAQYGTTMETRLVDFSPVSPIFVACAIACATPLPPSGPLAKRQWVGMGCAFLLALLPAIWFYIWSDAGYVQHAPWFVHVRD